MVIEDILQTANCRTPDRIVSIGAGMMTRMYELSYRGCPGLILRVYPPGRADLVEYEPALLTWARAHGIPAPRVISSGKLEAPGDSSYLLYEKLPGRDLAGLMQAMPDDLLGAALDQAMRFMDAFAELDLTGYGRLLSVDAGRVSSWRAFIDDAFERVDKGVASGFLTDADIGRRLRALHVHADEFDPQHRPRFAWGDFAPGNLLVDARGRITGMIDFEAAFSCAPAMTYGYAFAMWRGTKFWDMLAHVLKQAGDAPAEREIWFYAVVRGLRMSSHAAEPLPDGRQQRPLDDVLPGFLPALKRLSGDL